MFTGTVRCLRGRFSAPPAIEMYELALEALRKASDARSDEEERLQKEQIEAIERQRQKSRRRTGNVHRSSQRPRDETAQPKDRAAGIAMVKKIVQQTQQTRQPGYVQVEQTRKASDVDGTIPPSDPQSEDAWLAIANERIKEAALRHGHPQALVRLGNLSLEKTSTLVDLDKLSKWADDSPLDLSVLASLLHGTDSGSSRDVALYMYENAGEQGSADGWYNFGHVLWETSDDRERSLIAFHRAMDLGDPDATYFLAAQYLASDEVGDEDRETLSAISRRSSRLAEGDEISLPSFAERHDELRQCGYRLLHRAANCGHGQALQHLALLHYEHNDDEGEFVRLLAAACRSGNAESLFVRGHSHYTGTDGHPLDPAAALDDFLGASENGHADAMVSAGALLHQGVRDKDGAVVVARDRPRAFQLYQGAGELGSKEGWRNVVSCYASGEGVPKCVQTAKYIAKTMLGFDVEDR